jgi:predicted lipoprotein with Yx(FWY)xxD motif
MKKSALLAFAPVATAVVIAGCGGSSGGGGAATAATTKPAGAAKAAPAKPAGGATPTVTLAPSKFGKILVGANGRTLYDFVADKTMASTCYGACASLWPPLTVTGTPKAGPGVRAALLGTTKRTDGTTEVTYNGHPLYYYAGDTAAGDTTGQAINQFGALWYVLAANGMEIHNG